MRPIAKPTLMDVARHAGVSVGTVSNVLNETRVVSDARRERVLEAVATLGYVPDVVANSLRTQKSRVIGLCVPHTAGAYLGALHDAFIEDAAVEQYQVMQVFSRYEPGIEATRMKALLAHRVAGVIIVPSFDPDEALAATQAAGVPAVIVDRPFMTGRFDQVTFDNAAAMAEATRALIDRGHRRIAYIARRPQLIVTRQRIEAFHKAMGAVPDSEAIVRESGDDEAAYIAAVAALVTGTDAPTALIASNSLIALWTVRAFRRHGIAFPDDVSLLAFDEPEWADIVEPRLSVVRHPVREIARTAWRILIDRIGGASGPPQDVVLSAHVELHGSVGAPRRGR